MKVRPKLVVTGADDALAFYEQVLGARRLARYTMGAAVVLAELELPGGGTVQVKDGDEHDPGFRDPFGHEWIVGTPVTMTAEQVQAALDAWAASS